MDLVIFSYSCVWSSLFLYIVKYEMSKDIILVIFCFQIGCPILMILKVLFRFLLMFLCSPFVHYFISIHDTYRSSWNKSGLYDDITVVCNLVPMVVSHFCQIITSELSKESVLIFLKRGLLWLVLCKLEQLIYNSFSNM